MCSFNDHCERALRTQSFGAQCHSIDRPDHIGCPLPHKATEITFAKGSHLFHQGDHVRGGFSLTAGLVALERVNEDGEMVILKVLHSGTFFPCADLFTDGLHTTGARALTDISACFVPTDRLMAAMADPVIRALVLRHSGEEARESENIIFRLCAADLSERILAVLRQFADGERRNDNGSQVVILPLSWRDIAAMVGTSPEVLSRTLRKLAEAGRLSFTGRRVTLFDNLPLPGRVDAEAGYTHPHDHGVIGPDPAFPHQIPIRRGFGTGCARAGARSAR